MTNKTAELSRDEILYAYKEISRAYKELQDSHIEMIFRMAVMAEYRDPTTGGHLVRIADYSSIIADGLDLPKSEVEVIRYASPMHDIGKIMLPDTVLKKKGKLTDEEKALMMKHPQVGADIFKDAKSPIMRACRTIALTHHERYDGTGYPYGLKGEEIPLYGRIVALADCFDAFTSQRPYKESFSFERSVSMIEERAGGHFDPQIVRVFVRDRDKFRSIWESNRDIEIFLEDMGVNEEKKALDKSLAMKTANSCIRGKRG